MNVKKTKMMVLNGKIDEPVVIRGEKIEVETSFPYLGVSIRAEQSSSCEEVTTRISKAVSVFRALFHPLWKRKRVSVETKTAIYRAAVLPVLLYGSETWVLCVREVHRLESFQMKCLRVILGITKRDHWRNEEVREKTGQGSVGEVVTRSRLRWLGHVARMEEGRLPVQLLYGALEGKGKAGRPAGRWKDMIEADLRKRGVVSWYTFAQDRGAWRKMVNGEAVVRKRRGRKGGEEKSDGGEEGSERAASGLTCPTCGKSFRSRKGGWFNKHVTGCGSSRSNG